MSTPKCKEVPMSQQVTSSTSLLQGGAALRVVSHRKAVQEAQDGTAGTSSYATLSVSAAPRSGRVHDHDRPHVTKACPSSSRSCGAMRRRVHSLVLSA